MTTKTDFTPEEWDALLAGPLSASLYIVIASPSVFGSIKEITAMSKELARTATRPDNTELLRFMLADYQEKETLKRVMPDVKGQPDEVKAFLRSKVQDAVALLNEKATPEESQQIREWMHELAVKVAEAAREGGFLGIGAVRVNEAEKEALAELSAILGLTEEQPEAASAEEGAVEEAAPEQEEDAGEETDVAS